MLGTNLPLRETIQLKCFPKRTCSLSQSKFPPYSVPRNHLKKMETKQSYIYESMKTSIFSDDNYNTMIYQWRKIQQAPIVKVVEIARISQINSFTGLAYTHKTIKPQQIQCHLSNYNQFTKQQLLLILKTMLDGHQAIFKKLKATSVSLDKSFITKEGEIKVWINQHLERNDISGEILNKEEDIAQRIFQTVGFLATNNGNILNDLMEYVNSAMKKNGLWNFSYLRALIKSYSDCLKIKIPKNLINKGRQNKQYIQYSLIENPANEIENSKHIPIKKIKQGSLIVGDRNTQSSLHCSQNQRRQSQTNQPPQCNGISLNSFNSSRTTTSKSINENSQKSLSFKTLFKRSKHISSFSRLIKNSNIAKSNLLSQSQIQQNYKQHKKVPSYNQILIKKIGITPLQEVQDQYCLSPSGKKTPRIEPTIDRFIIAQQFNVRIETTNREGQLLAKNSIISTNPTSTSGHQFCFSKKIKRSNIDINIEQKQNKAGNEVYRTASKDRFKQKITSLLYDQKKTKVSCTNWSSNRQTTPNIDNIVKLSKPVNIVQTKQEQHEESIRSFSKLQIDKQVLSYQNIQGVSSKQIITLIEKSQMDLFTTCRKNPIQFLNQLKSEQQIDQTERAQKILTEGDEPSPLDTSSQQRILVQQKLLQLLNLNKRLVTSTYMQTQFEKRPKPESLATKQKKKKLKQFEETINSLMRANKKQQQILEQNCWKKTLETLLSLDKQELKQSISVEEANTLIRELKLSKLGKWGREIQKSMIPD